MRHQKRFVGKENGKIGGRYVKLTKVTVLLVLIAAIFMAGCITPETKREFTEAESREIARVFVESSPTYQFDGFDLEYKATYTARCPNCWVFVFEFKSRHAGYGNRTGQVLAQVITPHTANVSVEQGEVTSATLDGKWNMLTQTYIPESKMTIEEAMVIAQNGECVQEGTLTNNYVYNEDTRTWWIDLDPYTEREECNPACVVYEDTKTAEINWRCTGALSPE